MSQMFGDLWSRASVVDPLYPADLEQPEFTLPFYPHRVWALTGGPHSAWGAGGALAALDFAPPMHVSGCAGTNAFALAVADGVLAERRAAMEAKGDAAWKPVDRERVISAALQAYALMATSADKGAVRDVSQIQRRK